MFQMNKDSLSGLISVLKHKSHEHFKNDFCVKIALFLSAIFTIIVGMTQNA